jgi:FkbM family methyltransferase
LYKWTADLESFGIAELANLEKKLKKLINGLIGITGYQFTRQPSLARDVAMGKYQWLQERNIATVLDIGANTGQFAEMIRQICPRATIYAFEPLDDCFRILTAKALSLEPMRCFPFALGNERGVMTIHHNEFSPSSSFLQMARRHHHVFPHTRNNVEEQVAVRRLDEVVHDLAMKAPVLAKLDVQGYELTVLAGAEKTLPLVDVLIVETSFVELYERQPLFGDVFGFLVDHGFSFSGNLEQTYDPSNGAVLQADSIFVRT